MILKSNTNLVIGDKPMVLLPMDIYENIIKSLNKQIFKKSELNIKDYFSYSTTETSLSKDWLKLEEEKTWQNL